MNDYRVKFRIYSRDYLLGYYNGYRSAVMLLYPNVDQAFKYEPDATEMTCRAIALERLLSEKK